MVIYKVTMDYEEYPSTWTPVWPNPANRVLYPPITGIKHCIAITKPLDLNQHYIDIHETFKKEHDELFEQKQYSEKKLADLITQLDTAEKGVKGVNVWSRKNNVSNENLVKRLTSEVDIAKKNDDSLQEKIDTLIKSNTHIIALVSIHSSRVKAYDEYIAWKLKTEEEIKEAISNTA